MEYTIEQIVEIVSNMPAWDQKEIIRRLQDGGQNTVVGRYRFQENCYF